MAETPNQTETVPKTEFDQLQSKASEATRTMEALKDQLLAPEYLSYLESRKAPKPAVTAPGAAVSLANMTLEQLQSMLQQGIAATVQEALKPLTTRLNDVQVKQELAEVIERHDDFPKFREKVVEILQTSTNELTIEQAYLMAKAQAPVIPPAVNTPAVKAPSSNERPSANVPLDGESVNKYKNPDAAGTAAWSEVAAKHGLSGDTI